MLKYTVWVYQRTPVESGEAYRRTKIGTINCNNFDQARTLADAMGKDDPLIETQVMLRVYIYRQFIDVSPYDLRQLAAELLVTQEGLQMEREKLPKDYR
jgi:hypothetical protein